jgi:FixJ family two-component response regulator
MPAIQSTPVVAIVEDDASMSSALERILRLGGHTAVSFPSAEEYLAGCDGLSVACLIVDVQLPGMNGFELRDKTAMNSHQKPVIFITAHDDVDSRSRAEQADAVAFLAKPFSGRALLEAVGRALWRGRRS